ncbi:hypothetical protein BDW67DRAFT_180128 [Aspergillus spinulosporus]
MSSNDKSTSESKSYPCGEDRASGSTSSAANSTSLETHVSTLDPSLRDAVAVANSYAQARAAVEAAEDAALTEDEARGVLDALGIQLAPGEDASTKLKSFAYDLAKHRGSSF